MKRFHKYDYEYHLIKYFKSFIYKFFNLKNKNIKNFSIVFKKLKVPLNKYFNSD